MSDLPTLDPALAFDAPSFSIASLVYGGLVRMDSRLRVVPDGASRWTIGGRGTVYTFTIRRGLRFADGTRVTAADFAAALKRSLGPAGEAGSAPAYLSLIAHGKEGNGIRVVNAHTLRLRLVHPAGHFLAELTFPSAFVPDAHTIARYGMNWTDHALGFGPYRVKSWQHLRSLTLVRNPYYYAGLPPINRITVRFFPTAKAALQAYRAGKVAIVSGLGPGSTFGDPPAGLQRVSALALDYLAFNTARFPFHHLNARRAFAAVATHTHVPGSTTFAPAGLLPPAFGLATPLWSAGTRPATYLKLAQYNGKHPLPRLTFVAPRDGRVTQLAAALRDAWETQLHASVTLRLLNASNYDTVLNDHAFDLALVEWGGDYPDPQDFLGTQLGKSGFNVTGWSTARYNRVVNEADALPESSSRRRALFELAARLAARKVPLLPLGEPTLEALVSTRLTGPHLTAIGTIVANWSHVHLKT